MSKKTRGDDGGFIGFHLCTTANLVLAEAFERIVVGDQYGDIPLGLYVIRGENVVLLGQIVRATHIVTIRRQHQRANRFLTCPTSCMINTELCIEDCINTCPVCCILLVIELDNATMHGVCVPNVDDMFSINRAKGTSWANNLSRHRNPEETLLNLLYIR